MKIKEYDPPIPHSALVHCRNCVFPPNFNCQCSCHTNPEDDGPDALGNQPFKGENWRKAYMQGYREALEAAKKLIANQDIHLVDTRFRKDDDPNYVAAIEVNKTLANLEALQKDHA